MVKPATQHSLRLRPTLRTSSPRSCEPRPRNTFLELEEDAPPEGVQPMRAKSVPSNWKKEALGGLLTLSAVCSPSSPLPMSPPPGQEDAQEEEEELVGDEVRHSGADCRGSS